MKRLILSLLVCLTCLAGFVADPAGPTNLATPKPGVTINWTNPAGLTNVLVFRSVDDGATFPRLTILSGTATTYTDTTVTNGKSYQYKVQGYAPPLLTAFSNTVTVVASVPTAPVTPPPGGGTTPPPPPPVVSPLPPRPPIVQTHPRLWVTVGDLWKLRSWAVPSNPYWVAFQSVLDRCVFAYQKFFFPNGTGVLADVAANPFPDPGDVRGYGRFTQAEVPQFGASKNVEEIALILAFDYLMTGNEQHAGMARNLVMYAFSIVAKGHVADAPFADPQFAVYDRSRGSVWQFFVVVDWIYPTLSAEDKATIRAAALVWAADQLTAVGTGGDHPEPVGVIFDKALLPNGEPYPMASNNYYCGHLLILTEAGLLFDDADDPNGKLGSYLNDAIGAWMYQQYAMFGDNAAADYGLPTTSKWGSCSGGLPPEGTLYGMSYESICMTLLHLKNCGCDDPVKFGFPVKMIRSPFVDRHFKSFLMWCDNSPVTMQSWQGPIYLISSGYGDQLQSYVEPSWASRAATILLLQQKLGNSSNADAVRWSMQNLIIGGPTKTIERATAPWTYGVRDTISYFLTFDPSAPAPKDPRPGYPLSFVDNGISRMICRGSWDPKASMFVYGASWHEVNHQQEDGGEFGLYRNGEALTKPLLNYDNYDAINIGQTVEVLNCPAVQNKRVNPFSSGDVMQGAFAHGSQYWIGSAAGRPVSLLRGGSDYAHAHSDLTNLYNSPSKFVVDNNITSVSHVSRAVVWVPSIDTAVIYTRATSFAGGFKREWYCTANTPTTTGSTSVAVTPGGQQLTVQSLLPANPTIASADALASINGNHGAGGETMHYHTSITDVSNPADIRFLTTYQGTDFGVAGTSAKLVQSTSGTPCDAAVIGSTAVVFKRNYGDTFSGTTVTLPSSVTSVYVSGVVPAATYSLSGGTIQPGAGGKADDSGLVKLGQ